MNENGTLLSFIEILKSLSGRANQKPSEKVNGRERATRVKNRQFIEWLSLFTFRHEFLPYLWRIIFYHTAQRYQIFGIFQRFSVAKLIYTQIYTLTNIKSMTIISRVTWTHFELKTWEFCSEPFEERKKREKCVYVCELLPLECNC